MLRGFSCLARAACERTRAPILIALLKLVENAEMLRSNLYNTLWIPPQTERNGRRGFSAILTWSVNL